MKPKKELRDLLGRLERLEARCGIPSPAPSRPRSPDEEMAVLSHRVNVVYAVLRSGGGTPETLPDRAVGTPDELLDALAWLQRTARMGEPADTRQYAAVLLAELRLHFSV